MSWPKALRNLVGKAGIAHRIFAPPSAAGWPVGANLDTEQALLHRYEVSRSVLREAIRLLEAMTVAVMRRGPSGGLIVAQPSLESGSVPSSILLPVPANVRSRR